MRKPWRSSASRHCDEPAPAGRRYRLRPKPIVFRPRPCTHARFVEQPVGASLGRRRARISSTASRSRCSTGSSRMPRCTAASTSWPRHGATSRVSTTAKPRKLRRASTAGASSWRRAAGTASGRPSRPEFPKETTPRSSRTARGNTSSTRLRLAPSRPPGKFRVRAGGTAANSASSGPASSTTPAGVREARQGGARHCAGIVVPRILRRPNRSPRRRGGPGWPLNREGSQARVWARGDRAVRSPRLASLSTC